MLGGSLSGVIIPPSQPKTGDPDVRCEDYFLPAVLLWDPYSLYPSIFPPGSIKCNSEFCCGATKFFCWNDGSTASKQPRTLHDMHFVVLLVSAIYACDSGHKVLAHDESVLKVFPSYQMVPFILLCKTGFTVELVDTCTSLCIHGMNFYKIETFILERRLDKLARMEKLHQAHHNLLGDTEVCKNENKLNSPSNDIIAKVVLTKFLKDEWLYLAEITSVPVGESISFDHTFKVAANIGFSRDDGVWVHQYDSLFIVLGQNGKVLTWQLTKGTGFSQIGPLLTDRKQRGSDLKCIYSDDCCKLRAKIGSIFGDKVLVKLDLFHAVKRIITTLRKKHPLSHQCRQDLQLVFRKDGDSAPKRSEATPEPDVINTKLEKFVSKWKDIEDEHGKKVFSSDTLEAVRKLKEHILFGCLSNIPPGGGTNRNERLHHHLNSHFRRTKMGILLAYALLTIVIHTSEKRHGRLITKSINSSCVPEPLANVKPIGILPKLKGQEKMKSTDHWEIDLTENMLDMELVVPIMLESLRKYNHYKQ